MQLYKSSMRMTKQNMDVELPLGTISRAITRLFRPTAVLI